jgi:hypothetical protein
MIMHVAYPLPLGQSTDRRIIRQRSLYVPDRMLLKQVRLLTPLGLGRFWGYYDLKLPGPTVNATLETPAARDISTFSTRLCFVFHRT